MLLSYAKPQEVDQNIFWTKPEDIFEYMHQNKIEKVYFSHTDSFSEGNNKDFQTFSRELFDNIMKLAHSKTWYDSGAFEMIAMIHNGHTYFMKVFESRADPNNAYDTLYTIKITT